MARVNSFLGKRAATTRVQKARLPAVAPSARHPATTAGKATAPLGGVEAAGRGAYHRQPVGSPWQPPTREEPWPTPSPPAPSLPGNQPFSSAGLGAALRGGHHQRPTRPEAAASPPPWRPWQDLPPSPPAAPLTNDHHPPHRQTPPGCPRRSRPAFVRGNTEARASPRASGASAWQEAPAEGPRVAAQPSERAPAWSVSGRLYYCD